MVQLLTHGFNPAYRTYFLACLLSPAADRVVLPAVQAASAAKCLHPHLHPFQQRDYSHKDTGMWGNVVGDMEGSHSRSMTPEICCFWGRVGGAQGRKEGENLVWHLEMLCWTTLSCPLDWTVKFSLSNFSTLSVFSLGMDQYCCPSSTAVLCILWIILLSTAVVQAALHGKGLGLLSSDSLASVVLLDDYEKSPVSTSHRCFRSSKTNNSEFHDIFCQV